MTETERKDDVSPPDSGPAADAPSSEADPNDVDGLRAKLAEERDKTQTYMSNWQRAAADYQNFKRRVEQERSEVGRLANAAFVINLLPLIDDLERALGTVDAKLAGLTWIDGIWLIYRKFQQVLENAGVKEIQADGQTFDPNIHEAIQEAPGEDGKVLSVVQRGYMLGDRVIRPAMVIVGRGGGEKPDAGSEKDESAEEAPGGDTQADLTD